MAGAVPDDDQKRQTSPAQCVPSELPQWLQGRGALSSCPRFPAKSLSSALQDNSGVPMTVDVWALTGDDFAGPFSGLIRKAILKQVRAEAESTFKELPKIKKYTSNGTHLA